MAHHFEKVSMFTEQNSHTRLVQQENTVASAYGNQSTTSNTRRHIYGKGNAPLKGCIWLLIILNSMHNNDIQIVDGQVCTPKQHRLENKHTWQLCPVV